MHTTSSGLHKTFFAWQRLLAYQRLSDAYHVRTPQKFPRNTVTQFFAARRALDVAHSSRCVTKFAGILDRLPCLSGYTCVASCSSAPAMFRSSHCDRKWNGMVSEKRKRTKQEISSEQQQVIIYSPSHELYPFNVPHSLTSHPLHTQGDD